MYRVVKRERGVAQAPVVADALLLVDTEGVEAECLALRRDSQAIVTSTDCCKLISSWLDTH